MIFARFRTVSWSDLVQTHGKQTCNSPTCENTAIYTSLSRCSTHRSLSGFEQPRGPMLCQNIVKRMQFVNVRKHRYLHGFDAVFKPLMLTRLRAVSWSDFVPKHHKLHAIHQRANTLLCARFCRGAQRVKSLPFTRFGRGAQNQDICTVSSSFAVRVCAKTL